MATTAGPKKLPRGLRIIQGKGSNAEGKPLDSGGRVIEPDAGFRRVPPEKPEGLSDDASHMWDVIVEEMSRVELLKPIDAGALEVACETWARWREAVRMRRDEGITSVNSQGTVTAPWVGVEERASKDFRAWCAEFGLTPAAEGKLNVSGEGGADANPFD